MNGDIQAPITGRLPIETPLRTLSGPRGRRAQRAPVGRSPDWLKFKNPVAPAAKREAGGGLE